MDNTNIMELATNRQQDKLMKNQEIIEEQQNVKVFVMTKLMKYFMNFNDANKNLKSRASKVLH